MTRKLFGLLTIGLALSLVPGAMAQDSEPLKVGMTTWAGYGLIHLAERKGFFDKRGVDVEIVATEDKPSTAAAIATGRLHGWATTVDTFIFYDAGKLGLRQVLAVDFDLGGAGIIAAGDIETLADLKGRTVAADEGSAIYFFLLYVLADAGLTIDDIQLLNMRAGDAGAAFVAGRIEAAGTWDPWLARAKERKGARVLVTTRDKPGVIVDTVAFRTDVIEDRRDDVIAFIQGYFDAYDYWQSNPTDANQVMARSLGITNHDFLKALQGIEYVSRANNREYFGTNHGEGNIIRVIELGGRFYREAGHLERDIDAESLIDRTLLDAALAR